MNFDFLNNIAQLRSHQKKDVGSTFGSTTVLVEQPKQKALFDTKLLGWSILSAIPWALSARDKTGNPATINKKLKRHAQRQGTIRNGNRSATLHFRPYVCKVPWHTGPRAFFCQLFPRYGHYCGPNWSSGKNCGSLIWDQRPIDWLDYCCYCHDIGYDTNDQARLLEADLSFLECLERSHTELKGDAHVAHLYKTMCIAGLKNFLIPYRTNLVNLRSGRHLLEFGWLSNLSWWKWNMQKN